MKSYTVSTSVCVQ